MVYTGVKHHQTLTVPAASARAVNRCFANQQGNAMGCHGIWSASLGRGAKAYRACMDITTQSMATHPPKRGLALQVVQWRQGVVAQHHQDNINHWLASGGDHQLLQTWQPGDAGPLT